MVLASLTEKGRRRETESEMGVKSALLDPKPGDLSMTRVKGR